MAKPYGKFKRQVARSRLPELPRTVNAQMFGRNDLEEVSRLFETLIARLQDEGVARLENLRVSFDPLGRDGASVAIRENGKPVDLLKIHLPAALRFGKAVSF